MRYITLLLLLLPFPTMASVISMDFQSGGGSAYELSGGFTFDTDQMFDTTINEKMPVSTGGFGNQFPEIVENSASMHLNDISLSLNGSPLDVNPVISISLAENGGSMQHISGDLYSFVIDMGVRVQLNESVSLFMWGTSFIELLQKPEDPGYAYFTNTNPLEAVLTSPNFLNWVLFSEDHDYLNDGSVNISVIQAPEPGTLAMMILGLLGVSAARIRARKSVLQN